MMEIGKESCFVRSLHGHPLCQIPHAILLSEWSGYSHWELSLASSFHPPPRRRLHLRHHLTIHRGTHSPESWDIPTSYHGRVPSTLKLSPIGILRQRPGRVFPWIFVYGISWDLFAMRYTLQVFDLVVW